MYCLKVVDILGDNIHSTSAINLIGKQFLFTAESSDIIIGRSRSNTINISDLSLSKHHCKLSYIPEKQGFLVTDQGSKHGSFLEGKRLLSHVSDVNINQWLTEASDGNLSISGQSSLKKKLLYELEEYKSLKRSIKELEKNGSKQTEAIRLMGESILKIGNHLRLGRVTLVLSLQDKLLSSDIGSINESNERSLLEQFKKWEPGVHDSRVAELRSVVGIEVDNGSTSSTSVKDTCLVFDR